MSASCSVPASMSLFYPSITCSVVSNSMWPHGLVAHQAPLSMGFSRQEYWSGLPFPPPVDLPNQGTEHSSDCRWIFYCLNYQGNPTSLLENSDSVSDRIQCSFLTVMDTHAGYICYVYLCVLYIIPAWLNVLGLPGETHGFRALRRWVGWRSICGLSGWQRTDLKGLQNLEMHRACHPESEIMRTGDHKALGLLSMGDVFFCTCLAQCLVRSRDLTSLV